VPTSRLEAFSDGVFAIAITLLVLDIKVNSADFDHLGRALAHEWPAYLAYVTSFLTVGSVWIAHHGFYARLRFIDPVLLRINLLLLMVVAFLPFPTAVLAAALHHSGTAERTAVVFYGAIALTIEVLISRGEQYADSRPDLTLDGPSETSTRARRRRAGWRGWLGTALYAAAILVGVFFFPRVALAGYLAVAVRGVMVLGGEGHLSPRIRGLGPR
jgi:uncharacterized membrane protein